MAFFYNAMGSSVVQGTSGLDRFFAFTKDDNFDHLRADATIASFSWTTGIGLGNGLFYTISSTNMQISQDVYFSNGGTDVLYGSTANDAIFFNNGSFADGVGGINGIQQFYMGFGNDVVDFSAHGPGGADYVKQLLVHGEDGNDTLVGGSNSDDLFGDAGDDFIVGNAGGDIIDGGDGDDTIYGDDLDTNAISGKDILRGRGGDDLLYGGAKADQLEGGDGNDTLYGGLSDDQLFGGAGNDVLYGDEADGTGNGGDRIYGDNGDDQLIGGAGLDYLDGGADADRLDGGTGDDILKGRTGNDRLIGGAGNDTLDGGEDTDTAVYSGNRGDYLIAINTNGTYQVTDTRTAAISDGSDSLNAVEFVEFADGTISFNQLNHAPVITSNSGGAVGSASLNENTTVVTTVTATDEDVGQTITFGIAGGVDAALFKIDAGSGVLSFVNAPDFENPIDADGNGLYDVIVQASDGANPTMQRLAVSVVDQADGAAPVITSNGGGKSTTVAVDENTTAVTTVIATDADSPAPTYKIAGGLDASLFLIDTQTGALRFISAPDYEAPADSNHDNVFQVTVEATDGLNGTRQAVTIALTNVNDNAPTIVSPANVAINENTSLATTVIAQDADTVSPGFAPTFSIISGLDAALFTIDAKTGALTFLAAPDFEVASDTNHDNIYDVVVKASDGVSFAQQTVSISVANLNDNAPRILSNGGGASAAIGIAENARAVTIVTSTDADGGTPSLSIAGGEDAALFALDPNTGALTFRSAPDYENPEDVDQDNVYKVTVQSTDGTFTTTQNLSVTISDVNEIGRTITGTGSNDTITPTAAAALRTTVLNDIIYGLAGNDIIDGGAGTDRMEGGSSNDIYTVDSYSDDGRTFNDDLVIETSGGGSDRVNASVSYVLASEVENLTLLENGAINGTGNDLGNQIIGNSAANILSGKEGIDTLLGNDGNDTISGDGGDDILVGGGGDDSLFGGADNDRLDGGLGADALSGGAGNDIYIVDSVGDMISEAAAGGVDSVTTSITYTLSSDVEMITLGGTAAIDGTGNDLANTITGNGAANRLIGLVGSDTINGLGGDDFLDGGDDSDILDGGAGNDTVLGGAASDTLKGSAGADIIVGGLGKDTLSGGSEADIFRFNFADTTLNTNYDRITDFQASSGDLMDLDFVLGTLPTAAYAEATVQTNNFSDALALANTMVNASKSVVFIAGTIDGWLFWDGAGRDGLADQAVLLTGLNSTNLFSDSSIV